MTEGAQTFKVGDKVQTRSGLAARILCHDRVTTDYPVIALVTEKGGESIIYCRANGRLFFDEESSYDLVPIPKQVTTWVVLWKDGTVGAYRMLPRHTGAALYKLELEEGHFDE